MAAALKQLSYLALLDSGQNSDFVNECHGAEFKVHQAIFCSQSTMLERAADGNFREAREGRIRQTEEDPRILSRVPVFLYTNDYDALTIPGYLQTAIASSERHMADTGLHGQSYPVVKELPVHVLVFEYADMLDIEPLKRLASGKFLLDAPSLCDEPTFAKPLS
ncbi:hypothetical protein G647_08658 [Cladophialophora carrionii CBS 160.54]|uniref:BTB domain-containing protein n=1 Tax=Cladophialophora carrionii CBS 160.54 TaxID=1279043 RepID=V9CZ20_9EURO|nr:uncharacterized protein G647_08658 [Cladophialophora carrionii CBS 160.54]ETI19646.1 hypothetical protein G647_08658 [Cladophialophora carrionii CBS 160.54]